MASAAMNAERAAETFVWGARAVALAEQLGDLSHRVAALNDLGTMEYLQGLDGGRRKLEQSLALAREHGYENDAGRAYIHLCWASVRKPRLRARRRLRAGRVGVLHQP